MAITRPGGLEVLVGAVVLDPDRAPGGSRPRVGLVLGAGGVLGAAWMTGALPSVQDRLPCPINDVDVVIGTSAGSVLAAALRCRSTIEEMLAFQRGEAAGPLHDPSLLAAQDGPLPPLPHWQIGSPPLLRAALLTPHRVPPWVGASAWLPRGRGRHVTLRATVHALHQQARHRQEPRPPGSPAAPPHWAGEHWAGEHWASEHWAGEHWAGEHWASGHWAGEHWASGHWAGGRTWIVAVDYDSGQRVIFGREGAPHAVLPDAVVASCSIPGWYEPVVIDGRRYVDGGVRSSTSLGLMAGAGVDEVYVLAPMASTEPDRPRKPHERLERRLRHLITHGVMREARALRSRGVRVTVITPGPEDLAVMGVNLMDPRRREAVLETSLRTCAAALGGQDHGQSRVA
ncbi:MAG TPA: patatin-like phospholipase family protein [Streptosporangiaceae bacterium]|nr:patatin-like phospholipase family protein [Streptosporangiaceae bacterium]